MNEPKPWYAQWKRLAPLLGVLVVALNRKLGLGLSEAEISHIVWLIIALVAGLSLPDAAGALAKGMSGKNGNAVPAPSPAPEPSVVAPKQ